MPVLTFLTLFRKVILMKSLRKRRTARKDDVAKTRDCSEIEASCETKRRKRVRDSDVTATGQDKGTKLHSAVTPMGNSPLLPTPCGHKIHPSDINSMVTTCLDKKSLDFSCPVCREAWQWEQLQELMQLSQEQLAEHQKRVDKIVEACPEIYKKCPTCSSILKRLLDSAGQPCQFCRCPRCPQSHLCWSCLSPWCFPSEAGAGHCGNRSCDVVAVLLSCDTVNNPTSHVFGCPVFRACPKCHGLIMHTVGCKYVVCPNCNHNFCFICLQKASRCCRHEDMYFSLSCKKQRAARQRFVT